MQRLCRGLWRFPCSVLGRPRGKLSGAPSMSQLDYAVIGNCQTSALVDKGGRVSWACFPRFAPPPAFASILDPERGGSWSIDPAIPSGGMAWETRQHYM